MTIDDLKEKFTKSQLDFLVKNKVKPQGSTDAEVLANYARVLWDNRQWSGNTAAEAKEYGLIDEVLGKRVK